MYRIPLTSYMIRYSSVLLEMFISIQVTWSNVALVFFCNFDKILCQTDLISDSLYLHHEFQFFRCKTKYMFPTRWFQFKYMNFMRQT